MNRTPLFFAVGVVATVGFAAFATQAARQPLLSATKATPAGLTADASYRALAEHRATVSLQLVQADASQIDAGTDRIQLGLGAADTVYLRSATRNADGTLVWSGTLGRNFGPLDKVRSALGGEIADDPNNAVVIVRNGDRLTGTIRSNGQLYALEPLRSGGHAIVRIDEAKMPADHPAAYAALLHGALDDRRLRGKAQVATGAKATRAPATVRVMVVFSQSAANAVGDTLAKANLAIAESNQSFANSGANVTFQLAGVYTANYVNSSFDTDLSRFRSTTDGYLDSYHTTRNTIGADVNVLITTNTTYCGLGYLNSSASSAFSVTSYSCMTGYYSFAHEIGHNFGARHDPQTDPSTTPYAYGHGYRSPTNTWRTIMAYNCSPSCPRINYWSNPAKTYNGQAMGTTATSNNARVLSERAATVAAFR
jgi:peptidyl-Asp metalloendopeptidase